MSVRVVLVGQGPNMTGWKLAVEKARSRGLDEQASELSAIQWCARVAITGAVGEALAKLAGVHRLTLYSRCDRVNLNARWLGKVGKGDVFDTVEGKATAERTLAAHHGETRFVLLGRNAAACFGLRGEPLSVHARGDAKFLLMPHPSRVNRWWNEPANTRLATTALRRFLRGSRCALALR